MRLPDLGIFRGHSPDDPGKANVTITIQGDRLTVKVLQGPARHAPPIRGDVGGFSAASRLRLMTLISSLDYSRQKNCTFLTLTWPDWVPRPDPAALTQARSVMQRAIETLSDSERPGVWRIEWMPRKSGRWIGALFPHVHVVYYHCPFLPLDEVRRHWRQAVGTSRDVRLRLELANDVRNCSYYAAKYLTKRSLPVSLSMSHNSTNRSFSRKGRHWGAYRKAGLPWATKITMQIHGDDPRYATLRKASGRLWEGIEAAGTNGYTLFGRGGLDAAREAGILAGQEDSARVG